MTRPSSNRARVRMRDVAARCGVSVSTVSLVLSGDTRIPEDTARRILQAVKAMEYRPSILARSLARRTSRTIAVILPEFAFQKNIPFYYQALQGIHSQTQPAGYKMIVEAANRVFLARRYYLRMLKEQSADAMLYLAASVQDQFLNEIEKESSPFVMVGAYADDVNLPVAKSDDREAAKIATHHLAKLGHKAIGHIMGPLEVSHARDRAAGFREAIKEAGLNANPNFIATAHFDPADVQGPTAALVEKGVTAIVAGSDVIGYGVLAALRKMGKRVPEDVAVVGIDDLEMSDWTCPRLTTVRYDIRTMAELATKYVIRRAQTPMAPKELLTQTPAPELVVRESCGAK